jgi:hypothetical protein
MWEPRRLTTLWASTAGYRDSFTSPFTCQTYFLLYMKLKFRSVGFLRITTNHVKKLCMIQKRPSKTLVLIYQITRCHIQRDHNLKTKMYAVGTVSLNTLRIWEAKCCYPSFLLIQILLSLSLSISLSRS